MNITKQELKEFVVTRVTTIVEEKTIMATDWEDAEEQGNYQDQDWEASDHRTEVNAEEV